jgi:hypothetical protein
MRGDFPRLNIPIRLANMRTKPATGCRNPMKINRADIGLSLVMARWLMMVFTFTAIHVERSHDAPIDG